MIEAILVLALILRLVAINQSLWLDEATQATLSSQPLYLIVFERAGDFHPPLSYIIYHFWMMLGSSEIWLRVLPILFGVATIFFVYKIGQKLFNQNIALLSALLLSVAPYHIYYSQEVRMYSLAAFFATVSIWAFITNKRLWFVLSTIALVLTHYMGVFLIVLQIFYIVWKEKQKIKQYVLNYFFIFLGLLPILPFFWQQLQNGVNPDQYLPGWGNLLTLTWIKAVPILLTKFTIGKISFDNEFIYLSLALFIFILLTLLFYKAYISVFNTRLIFFWFGLPIIITWLISFVIPMFQPFRLLFVLPAFYILLAVGLNQMDRYKNIALGLFLIISLVGLIVYYTNPKFWREDWREAVSFINKKAIENSIVLFAWSQPFSPYEWYQGKKGLGVSKKLPVIIDKQEIYYFEYLSALSDPQKNIQSWLKKNNFELVDTYDFNGVGFVYHFKKSGSI